MKKDLIHIFTSYNFSKCLGNATFHIDTCSFLIVRTKIFSSHAWQISGESLIRCGQAELGYVDLMKSTFLSHLSDQELKS